MNTRSRKQPLTAVQIAEMSEGEHRTGRWPLLRRASSLRPDSRARSATWVLRWYKGPRVLTLGLGSLQAVGKGAAEKMRDRDRHWCVTKSTPGPCIERRGQQRSGRAGSPQPNCPSA